MRYVALFILLSLVACSDAPSGKVCYRTIQLEYGLESQMLKQVPCSEPHIGDGPMR
jgi:hypothetical protein